MKIDDFMAVVDRYAAYPTWAGSRIHLYNSEETDPKDWFLSLNPNEDYLSPVFQWTYIDISKESMTVVLDAMTDLLMTPIDERF